MNERPRKVRNENANVAAVMGFILMAVMLIIGVVLLSNVNESSFKIVNSTYGSTSATGGAATYYWNTTFLNLVPQATSGYNLMALGLIITAAAVIIGILVTAFLARRPD